MDNSIFLGPVRKGKITLPEWESFRDDFKKNRDVVPYQYLRLGQAFINHMTEPGTVDPDLFYQRDEVKVEAMIKEFYIV